MFDRVGTTEGGDLTYRGFVSLLSNLNVHYRCDVCHNLVIVLVLYPSVAWDDLEP